MSASCKALCHLSYVWPGGVLPLVLSRFQAALQTATAMHMLPTSISALALCVRPLLLSRWQTVEETTQTVRSVPDCCPMTHTHTPHCPVHFDVIHILLHCMHPGINHEAKSHKCISLKCMRLWR